MKNISKELNDQITAWLDIHNIQPMNLDILISAFTHPSFKGLNPDADDYQRFEFLGDAVLDLVSAEELFQNKEANEETLTEERKKLVNNKYLAQIFDQLQIQPFIRTAVNYIPSMKDKADFVEALFGAYFITHDYESCVEFWRNLREKQEKNIKVKIYELTPEQNQHLEILFDIYEQLGLTPKNAKSMLQELCQKQGLEIPVYEEIKRIGPDHHQQFKIKVTGVLFRNFSPQTYSAIGIGNKLKIAEIKAAEKLCDTIFLEYIPYN